MHKFILFILAMISLSACAAYKIVPESDFIVPENSEISVTKNLEIYPEGLNCFEPMMTFVTLGIIPMHCVDTYSVSIVDQEIGKVKVTSMQGWVTLLMTPFPTWNYGFGRNVENEIKELIQSKN